MGDPVADMEVQANEVVSEMPRYFLSDPQVEAELEKYRTRTARHPRNWMR